MKDLPRETVNLVPQAPKCQYQLGEIVGGGLHPKVQVRGLTLVSVEIDRTTTDQQHANAVMRRSPEEGVHFFTEEHSSFGSRNCLSAQRRQDFPVNVHQSCAGTIGDALPGYAP
jgi:hypothetical protein